MEIMSMFKIYWLLPLVMLLAVIQPELGSATFALAKRWLIKWARSNRSVVITVGAISLGLNVCLTALLGIPAPQVNDEFSYLLMADTFNQGRLANPTHPLWIQFESIHIIQQPTYASKYPVGQGVALAFGQQVTGQPVAGVWFSTALACAAVSWMLLAFVPRPWALLGGLLAAFQPEVVFQWGQSYWGGAVAMGGGAVAFGALRRIVERGRTRDALLLAAGLATLANSRPYEGLVLSLPVGAVLCVWLFRRSWPALRHSLLRVALPIAGVLGITALFMGYYNFRVTGNALQLPYQVYEAAYGAVTPLFLWQQPGPEPAYHHEVIRAYNVAWSRLVYDQQQALGGFNGLLFNLAYKLFTLARGFFWSLLLALPLIALPCALRKDRWLGLAFITGALLILSLLPTTWVYTHYAAPAAGLLFLLVVASMRELRAWIWQDRATGAALVHGVLALCAVSFALLVVHHTREPREGWQFERNRMLRQLQESSGKHLVIVRYQRGHNPHREWVYNRADIDGAKVVWAREMTPGRNRRLLDHFKDRQAWLVEADANPPTVVPYR